MWLGAGVIGGIGLGLGYISPVSTLIKWFPDRRGMATGMAIMGFGGGAMIGSPLATMLMNGFAGGAYTFGIPLTDLQYTLAWSGFRTPTDVGVWQTYVAMAAIYFAFMLIGAFGYRLPPAGWQPEGWTPPANGNAHDHLQQRAPEGRAQDAAVLAAVDHPVHERVGRHRHHRRGLAHAAGDVRRPARRHARPRLPRRQEDARSWRRRPPASARASSASSRCSTSSAASPGHPPPTISAASMTYFIFFTLGAALYVLASFAAEWKGWRCFVGCFCVIASMYGGGFATIPAYLADMFGTQFVGAIHGRLLTAWSTAGILGPVIVNYLHDTRQNAGIAPDQIYGPIFYMLAGLLVVGFIANLLVRPVNPKWHMSEADVDGRAGQAARRRRARTQTGSFGIGMGGLELQGAAVLAAGRHSARLGRLDHDREGAGAVPLSDQPSGML